MKRIALINHDAERLWAISKRLAAKSHDVLNLVDLADACAFLPVFNPHVILYDHGNSERLITVFNQLYEQNNELKLLMTDRISRLDNLKVPYSLIDSLYGAHTFETFLR